MPRPAIVVTKNIRSQTSTVAASTPILQEAIEFPTKDVTDAQSLYKSRVELAQILNVGRSSKSVVFWAAKRTFDVVLALSLLTLMSPIFLLICLVIKASTRGPIFFLQERVGERLRLFKIIKFRTMFSYASDAPAPIFDEDTNSYRRPLVREDQRITPFGRFLRQWSLDELPQVFNILKGDMSFIGPRPLCLKEALAIPNHALIRYSVPAGLSGLAQIRARGAAVGDERFYGDIEYVQKVGWLLETKIFFATFKALKDKY